MFALMIEYSNDVGLMEFELFEDALWEAKRIAECQPGVWSVWITDEEFGSVVYEATGAIPALAAP